MTPHEGSWRTISACDCPLPLSLYISTGSKQYSQKKKLDPPVLKQKTTKKKTKINTNMNLALTELQRDRLDRDRHPTWQIERALLEMMDESLAQGKFK